MFYVLNSHTLDVISIVDYSNKCFTFNQIDILSCECPFFTDESDVRDNNLVRIITKHTNTTTTTTKDLYKIYLYNIAEQINIQESPDIHNNISFCFAGIRNQHKNKREDFDKYSSNENTLIVIENNNDNLHSNKNLSSKQSTFINFYKPLKEFAYD